MTRNYTNKSVVKNIDTAFQYYKFPPSTIVSDFNFDDINIDFDIDQAGFDPVSGFHRIPEGSDSMVVGINDTEGQWENWRRVPNIYKDDGVNVDWNGGSYYGFTTIPFKQTLDGNSLGDTDKFVITPDIRKLCLDNDKVIKFTIQLALEADETGKRPYDTTKSKSKQGSDSVFQNAECQLRLIRTMPTRNRSNKSLGAIREPIYQSPSYPGATLNWDFFGAQIGDAAKGVMRDRHGAYRPKLRLEYIIDPTEAADYDIWEPQIAGKFNIYLFRSTSYWLIELIDDPGKGIANPNLRKRKYGKQPTNPQNDQFWDSFEERKKNTKYNTGISTRLDAAPEIKARKTLYATLRAKNIGVKAKIKSGLDAKQAIINNSKNIRYDTFKRQVDTRLINAFPDPEDLKFLIWSAKNDIPAFTRAVLEGFEVIRSARGGSNPTVLTQLNSKTDELATSRYAQSYGAYNRFGRRSTPANTFTASPTIPRVEYQSYKSGVSKTVNRIWNRIGSTALQQWAEAIRFFALSVYDSAPPVEAAANKKGSYWANYIKSNGGRNLVGDLSAVYVFKYTSLLQQNILDKLKGDDQIRNEKYYIPKWADGKNHSETSGDGDFTKKVQGETFAYPYRIGSFADPTWGADIYKG